MSKKGKAKAKLERLKKKRAAKAANKAKYDGWRRDGINTKSVRQRRLKKVTDRSTRKARLHPEVPCGNLACVRCYPQYNEVPEVTKIGGSF